MCGVYHELMAAATPSAFKPDDMARPATVLTHGLSALQRHLLSVAPQAGTGLKSARSHPRLGLGVRWHDTTTEAVRLRVVGENVKRWDVQIPHGEYDGHIDWQHPDDGGEPRMTAVQLLSANLPALASRPCEVLRYLASGGNRADRLKLDTTRAFRSGCA